MPQKILTDSTGSYDLSQVAAVSPLTYKDRNGQVIKQNALLTLQSGRRCGTQSDYKAVFQQWQAVVNPAPAAAAAPAAPAAGASPAAAPSAAA